MATSKSGIATTLSKPSAYALHRLRGLPVKQALASVLLLVFAIICVGAFLWVSARDARNASAVSAYSGAVGGAVISYASSPEASVRLVRKAYEDLPGPLRVNAASDLNARMEEVTRRFPGADALLSAYREGLPDLRTAGSSVARVSAQIRSSPVLGAGAWQQALSPLLDQLQGSEVIRADQSIAQMDQAAAKSAGARFGQLAQQAKGLADAARQAQGMPSSDQVLLNNLVSSLETLSSRFNSLSPSMDAVALSSQVASTLTQDAGRAVSDVGTASGSGSSSSILPILSAGSMLGALLCALMVLVSLLRSRSAVGDVASSTRSVLSQFEKVDVLLGQMAKIVPGDGQPINPSEKIRLPADSVFHPVGAAVNRLVDAMQDLRGRNRQYISRLDQMMSPFSERLSEQEGHQQQSVHLMDQSREFFMSTAQQHAAEAERMDRLARELRSLHDRLQEFMESAQDGGFRLEGIRDKNQDIAKRLKRIGESSQGVSLSSDRIREMVQQIQVCAMNVGVEASSLSGEQGKVFTALANEVQRLSHTIDENADEVDAAVDVLLSDAGTVVSLMETTTSDVVENTRIADGLVESVREIGRIGKPLPFEASKMTEEIRSSALRMVERGKAMERALDLQRHAMGSMSGQQEILSDLKSVLKDLSRS